MKYSEYLKIKKILENNPEMNIIKWNIAPLEINPHRVELVINLELRKKNE